MENSDSYWMAHDALNGGGHPIRAVVWGAGTSLASHMPVLAVDIAGAGPVTGTAWYWGDLDPSGVRIAVTAAAEAPVLLRPAHHLWAAMASVRVQAAGSHPWPSDDSDTDQAARGWFGADLWDQLAPVRQAAGRVAQEAIPAGTITTWAASLR